LAEQGLILARQFTPVPGDGIHQSVLIVDDEPMARTLLRLMLVRAGFHVAEAEDGYDALDKVRKNEPDVVLLDVMMPGMDGIELCKVIRGRQDVPQTPILILSARGDAESIMRGIEAGANDYLPKPILHHDLVAKVRNMLGQNTPEA